MRKCWSVQFPILNKPKVPCTVPRYSFFVFPTGESNVILMRESDPKKGTNNFTIRFNIHLPALSSISGLILLAFCSHLDNAGTGTFPHTRDCRSRSFPGRSRAWTVTVRLRGWKFEERCYCNAVPPHPWTAVKVTVGYSDSFGNP